MKLELTLSPQARRDYFVQGNPLPPERVRLDVGRLALEPDTRAALFDTFGDEHTTVPPEVLRIDRVPESDWDFWLLIHDYEAAQARQKRRQRLTWGVGIGVTALLLLVLLNLPEFGIEEHAFAAIMLYTGLIVAGLASL